MTKFNAPLRNKCQEQRAKKAERKRLARADPKTNKLKNVPPPTSLSGKQKRKLFKKWRQEQKRALQNGLVTMDDIQMMAIDNQELLSFMGKLEKDAKVLETMERCKGYMNSGGGLQSPFELEWLGRVKEVVEDFCDVSMRHYGRCDVLHQLCATIFSVATIVGSRVLFVSKVLQLAGVHTGAPERCTQELGACIRSGTIRVKVLNNMKGHGWS
eukprot:Gb_28544 [translate_table: standard]